MREGNHGRLPLQIRTESVPTSFGAFVVMGLKLATHQYASV